VVVPDPALHEFPDKEKEDVVAGRSQSEQPASYSAKVVPVTDPDSVVDTTLPTHASGPPFTYEVPEIVVPV
jgi:hypothetical protein